MALCVHPTLGDTMRVWLGFLRGVGGVLFSHSHLHNQILLILQGPAQMSPPSRSLPDCPS